MRKLLERYFSAALSIGIRQGLVIAILCAWTPIAISIAVGVRAIQAIFLARPYMRKDNIPETLYSVLRIIVIVPATYFVATQTYSLIGGYWGRFIAILCAFPASMILHGIVLWFSDISKGPPYFDHHSPSDWPPLSLSETTEEYLFDGKRVPQTSEKGRLISLLLMTKDDQEFWVEGLTYNAHSPRHDHSISLIKANQVSKSVSNLNHKIRILVSDTATVSDVITESRKYLRGMTKPDLPLVLYFPALSNQNIRPGIKR